jgi:hypothetical protein
MTQRYHKAARDGLLDILKETTRKDCNTGDEDGMTPTLWAAFEGNLEALSVLVGRGGDPNKCDHYGNTALHLASARGHMECATFLVNFDVNIFSLDIDMHTPQELAAMNDCAEILRYLDSIAAKQELETPKKVKAMHEKAQKEAAKLLKNFKKIQKRADKMNTKDQKNMDKQMKLMEISSTSEDGGIVNDSSDHTSNSSSAAPKFSEMVLGTSKTGSVTGSSGTIRSKRLMGTVSKKLNLKKNNEKHEASNNGFNISSIEDGKRSVRKLKGHRRDSEILLVAPKIVVIDEDDHVAGDQQMLQQPLFSQPRNKSISAGMTGGGSIFDRNGFGSMAFRRNSMFSFNNNETNSESIGSAGSLAGDEGSDSPVEAVDDSAEFAPVAVFLAGLGMTDWMKTFSQEKIDLKSLTLLEDNDLRDMGLPTGPRKKILKAIDDRRRDLEEADKALDDSHL